MSDRISLGGTTLGGGQSTEDLGYTGGSSADSTTFDKPFSHFVPKIEYSISKLKSYVPPPQDTKNSYRREPSLTAGSVQMALKILNDAKTWAETRDRSTFVYSRYDTRDAWTNSRDMDIIRYMENAAIDPRPALFQASDVALV
ncbi:hypothetical protein I204_00481 [Kwoniella mangroviensis CBS 8886]|nr:hypothetical protein I204_00481 [Kwoniella mangroviensis CBS 8886]